MIRPVLVKVDRFFRRTGRQASSDAAFCCQEPHFFGSSCWGFPFSSQLQCLVSSIPAMFTLVTSFPASATTFLQRLDPSSSLTHHLTHWNMLGLTLGRLVCLGVKLKTRYLLPSDSWGFIDVGHPLWRKDWSVVYDCCWSVSVNHSQSETRGTHNYILQPLCQSQCQGYLMAGGIPPINSSCCQAPLRSRPKFFPTKLLRP
jgi:hypothetical protein